MCVCGCTDRSEKRLSRIATDSDLQRFVDGPRQDSLDGTKGQADLVDFSQMCQQLKAATQVSDPYVITFHPVDCRLNLEMLDIILCSVTPVL